MALLDSFTQEPIPEGRLVSYTLQINQTTKTRRYSLDTLVRFMSSLEGGLFDPIDRQPYPEEVAARVLAEFQRVATVEENLMYDINSHRSDRLAGYIQGGFDINQLTKAYMGAPTDKYSPSFLMYAVTKKDPTVVHVLLENGADPNFKGISIHESAFVQAFKYATYGNWEIAQDLIAHGAKLDPVEYTTVIEIWHNTDAIYQALGLEPDRNVLYGNFAHALKYNNTKLPEYLARGFKVTDEYIDSDGKVRRPIDSCA